MAIKRAPLKSDPPGKCSRWRVILYNPNTHKQEWFTVEGMMRDAQVFEREQRTRLAKGSYVSKAVRKTFQQVADAFLEECRNRGRRTATLCDYRSQLDVHLMPAGKDGIREGLAARIVNTLTKADFRQHFTAMHAAGASWNTVNKVIGTAKTILNFALDQEWVERNVLARFRPYARAESERRVSRGAFSEEEVCKLLDAATPFERALITVLVFTGARPGEILALDWAKVDLDAGCVRIERSWDAKGRKYVPPKTKAGVRSVPLAPAVVAELRAHRERSSGEGLVFPSRKGTPLHPSNVATRIWQPLRTRAGVPPYDMYGLRHSYATRMRATGASAYAVSRVLGHSRSALVDQIYAAHGVPADITAANAAMTARVLGARGTKLRVIDGGQDVRETLETGQEASGAKTATR